MAELTIEQFMSVAQKILERLDEIGERVNGARKEYLRVEEFGQLTGRSAYTVRRWVAEKRIDAIRIDGTGPRGRLLIPRSELRKLVAL